MKTLVIIAHPELKDSGTQKFLHDSQIDLEHVTWHPLPSSMEFDVGAEQKLLNLHDRIIFQFPLYWYSAPAILKQWQDQVLTRSFTYPEEDGHLDGKSLGIVTTLGVPVRQYNPGQLENFSLPELLRPYQALAQRAKMDYLTPFYVDQFSYMSPRQKAALLVRYRRYLTMANPDSFNSRQKFMQSQLSTIKMDDEQDQMMLNLIVDQIDKNQRHLVDLKDQINLIKRQEE